MADWEEISKRARLSVVQIMVTSMEFDLDLPYRQPELESARGSGFVVGVTDQEILIMTNAHVMEGSAACKIRFTDQGQTDHPAKLLKFVYFRDIALISVPRQANLDVQPLDFDDSATVQPGQQVLVIGFPLGKENVQSSIGNVSGIQSEKSDVEDQDKYVEQSYIQITAPINPGNSGGPVFNNKGKVIGIASAGYMFYQNIGYMIGSRAIFGVLYAMFKSPEVMLYPPRLGFEWNERPTGEKGIYIRDVYPSSCFFESPQYKDDLFENLKRLSEVVEESDTSPLAQETAQQMKAILEKADPQRFTQELPGMEDQDILLSLRIPNYYPVWFSGPSRRFFENPDNLAIEPVSVIEYFFDNLGSTSVTGDSALDGRKLLLQEIEDSIPMGVPVTAQIVRKDHQLDVTRSFVDQDVVRWMIRKVYPRLETSRLKYMIFSGMMLVETPSTKILKKSKLSYEKYFSRYIFVSYIFAGSEFDRLHLLETGDILTHINKKRVKTLDELVKALPSSGPVEMRFRSKVQITLPLEQIQKNDEYVRETYGTP